jgi:hypothetical protein
MQLTVKERLLLLNVLPGEGDIFALRLIRDLGRELSFSEEEHAALKFEDITIGENPAKRWDETADPMKDITIGPKAISLLCAAIEAIPKLPMDYLAVYEKLDSAKQSA